MGNTLKELGRLGQKSIRRLFLRRIPSRNYKAKRGIAVYKEMSENDDTIGAILFSIEMLIRQVSWDVQAGGTEAADEEAKDFILSCIGTT